MIVQFKNEKVSNPGSILITIDCNVVAFIVFEEGFHQPHKAHQTMFMRDIISSVVQRRAIQKQQPSSINVSLAPMLHGRIRNHSALPPGVQCQKESNKNRPAFRLRQNAGSP
ncbi:hypothetical protein TNCV_1820521 [Trichonephila clavipes]|nr:hypothetical protein TNCV_1820521 [Trichonephila clavipes]